MPSLPALRKAAQSGWHSFSPSWATFELHSLPQVLAVDLCAELEAVRQVDEFQLLAEAGWPIDALPFLTAVLRHKAQLP